MIASILPDIDMSDSVKFGFQVWNTFMKSVYALLTESPSQFKDGEIWYKRSIHILLQSERLQSVYALQWDL